MLRFPRRIALGLVALGVPLLGASTAQANIGASVAFTGPNVNRPVLTSAAPSGPGLVRYCFFTNGGAAVTPIGGGSYDEDDFFLGGYDDSFDLHPTTVNQSESNQCVIASFGTERQISQYTYAGVLADSVQAIGPAGPQGNEEDGVPLNVPTAQATKNGTRGFGTGPDLRNEIHGPVTGGNRIAFGFDQHVDEDELCDSPPCFTTDFLFYTQDGDLHGEGQPWGTGATIIGISNNSDGTSQVLVDYSLGASPPFDDNVADGQIATVRHRADTSDYPGNMFGMDPAGRLRSDQGDGGSRRNVMLSIGMTAENSGNGDTNQRDFIAANTVDGGLSNQVEYHFDGGVALTPRGLNEPEECFFVNYSNANIDAATDAAPSGPNSIVATFSQGDGFLFLSEMGVSAAIHNPTDIFFGEEGNVARGSNQNAGTPTETPCLTSQGGTLANTMGGKPIGGNDLAVGTAYTSGPDPLGLSRGTGQGQLRLRIDQRSEQDGFEPDCVNLINSQGAPFGDPPGDNPTILGNGSPYDPHVVVLQFDSAQSDQAAGLQILGEPHGNCIGSQALETFDGGDDNSVDDPNPFDDEHNVSSVFGFGGLTG